VFTLHEQQQKYHWGKATKSKQINNE